MVNPEQIQQIKELMKLEDEITTLERELELMEKIRKEDDISGKSIQHNRK